MWLRRFVTDLGVNLVDAVVLCDNSGAVHLAKNPSHHENTKLIRVMLYFIRDVVKKKEVAVREVDTLENAADMLTKALPRPKFEFCLELLNVE